MAFPWYCGWCGNGVAANPSFQNEGGLVLTCPQCGKLSVLDESGKVNPPPRTHARVGHLPADVAAAWDEAVSASGAGAYTASEIMCRKILMHVAVDVAASTPGKTFVQYIDDLEKAGYIPTGLKTKIDEIRSRGNIANHDLPASVAADAEKTLSVTRHLLVSIYELPNS
jgi:hypothetical protein